MEKNNKSLDEKEVKNLNSEENLNEDQRVRSLSPGTMVAKRFFRNPLSVAGVVIIVSMFVFAFLGGFFTPYKEDQTFTRVEVTSADYAGATKNKDFRYIQKDGVDFPATGKASIIRAMNNGDTTFEVSGKVYSLTKENDNLYYVSNSKVIAEAISVRGIVRITETDTVKVTDEMKEAYEKAVKNNESSFTVDDVLYTITKVTNNKNEIAMAEPFMMATKKTFNPASSDITLNYDFSYAALLALEDEETSFKVDNTTYKLVPSDESETVYVYRGDELYASISDYTVNVLDVGNFLSIEVKEEVEKAIANRKTEFAVKEGDAEVVYTLTNKNTEYTIKRDAEELRLATYEGPSMEHWLGTDANGMDVLTRLIYGGRVSLLVGFVVVTISTCLGVIFGGIAGYFGGWVDNLIMRIVDIFNCIPSMPLYIILGALMDGMKLDPSLRIFMLMFILGILSWPGIARMVRGQILSLREQEFMIATEATGLRVSRRIFKHLIPNVIPQLIVFATMGLGSAILTEATLSYLGLGVKFPLASWGNIINAVTSVHVMTNYWFIWIPAGILILLTVLGFNFIGDGLRDAFDPKMKR